MEHRAYSRVPEMVEVFFIIPFVKSCNWLFQNIMEDLSKLAFVISCHVFFPKFTVFLFPEESLGAPYLLVVTLKEALSLGYLVFFFMFFPLKESSCSFFQDKLKIRTFSKL